MNGELTQACKVSKDLGKQPVARFIETREWGDSPRFGKTSSKI